MATGKRAFEGKSQASLISAILKDEPKPISQLQPMTPPALDRLVRTCLAKDPDDRWQSAHDVMQELKWIAEGASSVGGAGVTKARGHRREWLPWTLAAFGLAAGVFGIAHGRRPPVENRVLRVNIALPDKVAVGTYLALSPDGRRLLFPGRKAADSLFGRQTAAKLPSSQRGSSSGLR